MNKAELAAEIAAIEKVDVETLMKSSKAELKARLDDLLDTKKEDKPEEKPSGIINIRNEKGKIVITDLDGKEETVPFRGGKRKAVIVGIIQKTKDRVIISSKPKVNKDEIERARLLGLCKVARVGLDIESIQSKTAKKLLTTGKITDTCDSRNITLTDLLTIQDAYCKEHGITNKIEITKV